MSCAIRVTKAVERKFNNTFTKLTRPLPFCSLMPRWRFSLIAWDRRNDSLSKLMRRHRLFATIVAVSAAAFMECLLSALFARFWVAPDTVVKTQIAVNSVYYLRFNVIWNRSKSIVYTIVLSCWYGYRHILKTLPTTLSVMTSTEKSRKRKRLLKKWLMVNTFGYSLLIDRTFYTF